MTWGSVPARVHFTAAASSSVVGLAVPGFSLASTLCTYPGGSRVCTQRARPGSVGCRCAAMSAGEIFLAACSHEYGFRAKAYEVVRHMLFAFDHQSVLNKD
ncbi:hypothetical protein GMORB2_6762 [Geosmithia morbida]|uniref:Uncharacterized protein n=1 Tax=Geosmithia morbida TaxID=1094350 RepID=A0A9P5D1X2_9HYPO|nr:uncharacterized protein GMORB2_6762 [Geosmithia morbida]KAF4123212.1 hypothetical protein GMORB2_6762 [Geosmithia morbida]